jgi:hypothetical protein
MKKPVLKQETRDKESGGNDVAVESEESQEQASHPSHSHLEIPLKAAGIFHIPTAPATKLMGKCKTKNRFHTFPQQRMPSHAGKTKTTAAGFALRRKKLEM